MNSFFFFNDTATTEIYTLSLHDALPISILTAAYHVLQREVSYEDLGGDYFSQRDKAKLARRLIARLHDLGLTVEVRAADRKSTRLNSSHSQISYAVFCLKKKTPCAPVHRRAPMYPARPRSHPRARNPSRFSPARRYDPPPGGCHGGSCHRRPPQPPYPRH